MRGGFSSAGAHTLVYTTVNHTMMACSCRHLSSSGLLRPVAVPPPVFPPGPHVVGVGALRGGVSQAATPRREGLP